MVSNIPSWIKNILEFHRIRSVISQVQAPLFLGIFCHWPHSAQAGWAILSHFCLTPAKEGTMLEIYTGTHTADSQVSYGCFQRVLLRRSSWELTYTCCQELPAEAFWQPKWQAAEERNDTNVTLTGSKGTNWAGPELTPPPRVSASFHPSWWLLTWLVSYRCHHATQHLSNVFLSSKRW